MKPHLKFALRHNRTLLVLGIVLLILSILTQLKVLPIPGWIGLAMWVACPLMIIYGGILTGFEFLIMRTRDEHTRSQ